MRYRFQRRDMTVAATHPDAEICGVAAVLVWAISRLLGARWTREWRMISRPIGTQEKPPVRRTP